MGAIHSHETESPKASQQRNPVCEECKHEVEGLQHLRQSWLLAAMCFLTSLSMLGQPLLCKQHCACNCQPDKPLQHCQCGRVDQALPNEDTTGSEQSTQSHLARWVWFEFLVLFVRQSSTNIFASHFSRCHVANRSSFGRKSLRESRRQTWILVRGRH